MTLTTSPITTHPPSNEPSPQRGRKRRRSSATSPPPATTSTSTNFRGRVRHRSPQNARRVVTLSPLTLFSPLNPKTPNPTTQSLTVTAPHSKYQKTHSTSTNSNQSPSSSSTLQIYSPRSKTRRSQSRSRSRSRGHFAGTDIPRRRQRTRSRSRAYRIVVDDREDGKGNMKALSEEERE